MKKVIFIMIFIISCNKKDNIYRELKINEVSNSSFMKINYDSIIIYGGPYFGGYKLDKIESDSIIFSLNFRIIKDTVYYKMDFDSIEEHYIVAPTSTREIANIFYNEKSKWYDDFDPPLPEAIIPSINIVFYKDESVYEDKNFLIVNDTLEYSDDFYKAVDFLYILQIKNVQNENVDEFVKNYKW